MECSQNVEHSKMMFLTIEKQVLRDIAEGVFRELELLTRAAYVNKRSYEHLKVIARYADALRRVCE